MTQQTTITTRPCWVCGRATVITLTPLDLIGIREWQEDGVLIQHALPHWSRDDRELLISGTHPACYDMLAGDR